MSDAVLVAVIAGVSSVAGILGAQIGEGVRQKRKRKYDKDDGKDKDMQTVKDGLKWLMYDRIRFLGQKYNAEKSVDFDDRRILQGRVDSNRCGLWCPPSVKNSCSWQKNCLKGHTI